MLLVGRDYIAAVLGGLNIVYLGLWGVYFVAMFLWYWFGLFAAGEVVDWFRQSFGILGFNFEAASGSSEVFASRVVTFFDWVGRTVLRDLVSLSLVSSVLFLWQRSRKNR
jgi:hypothetical protein